MSFAIKKPSNFYYCPPFRSIFCARKENCSRSINGKCDIIDKKCCAIKISRKEIEKIKQKGK
jgi:hypothetical protein